MKKTQIVQAAAKELPWRHCLGETQYTFRHVLESDVEEILGVLSENIYAGHDYL